MRQGKQLRVWHHPLVTAAIRVTTLCLLFASSLNAYAEIFRCTDDNGHVVFTQDPCGPAQQSEKVNLDKLEKNPKPSAKVCKQIENLAKIVFPHINDTDSILDIYSNLGGRKYLSAGATAAVNYVFNFRYNPKARQSNVVELTHDKCLDGGFGLIREKDLPEWDRIKYKKEKTKQREQTKQEKQALQSKCKDYDEKVKALQEQMDTTKDKNKKLQSRVDLEYYKSQISQQCGANSN